MKAVVIDKITPAENVELTECQIPEVKPGWVLVKVKAFGLNHSEQILRMNEINEDYIQKPVIPGIECVGEIVDPSDSNFKIGDKVAALMGGMGRSFNGSYAEYALLPEHHVFKIESSLSWAETGAVPETYFTAWGSLFECLDLKPEDTLLIRGATCALGYVAIQIAKALGCKVIATTHKETKLKLISNADKTVIDSGCLRNELSGVTKVLELVGAKTVRDSLMCVEKGGIVCYTGVLGGEFVLNNFDPIKEIPNGVYLTGFFSNYPTQKIMNDIFKFFDEKNLTPIIGDIYNFSDIKNACIALDSGKVNSKIVVKID